MDLAIKLQTRSPVAARSGPADPGRRWTGDVGGSDRDDWVPLVETLGHSAAVQVLGCIYVLMWEIGYA